MAKYLGIEAIDELSAGRILSKAIRELMQRVNLPLSLEQAGVANDAFRNELVLGGKNEPSVRPSTPSTLSSWATG